MPPVPSGVFIDTSEQEVGAGCAITERMQQIPRHPVKLDAPRHVTRPVRRFPWYGTRTRCRRRTAEAVANAPLPPGRSHPCRRAGHTS
ncbi:hypothetical protein STRTUCAR8_08010 [Streptomyces turgidiscabies Car8]|uniref:Uncharacterized protein n=1 Tax=Streptomyces turgidiscabies (strain Car8) TaxID=698760 RepID=L7F0L4_STRT8|nr:hypothetical protein STRTUCAR8_08010 [Streptomyces turgidiscabies Car8]